MAETTARPSSFLAGLEPLAVELDGRGPDWLRELRRKSRSRFEELGLPTVALEEWKNTSVAAIAAAQFRPAPPSTLLPYHELAGAARLELGGSRLVFWNGRLVDGSSGRGNEREWVGLLSAAPERVASYLIARPPETAAAFASLNGAFLEDGAVVLIGDGVVVERPIELVFASGAGGQPTISQPRTVIVLGKGSRATVIETYCGLGGDTYLTNAVTDVLVGPDAVLEHYRLQLEGAQAYHVSACTSRQSRGSHYMQHAFDLGGRLVRHDLLAVLDGEGADCRLNGLYVTGAAQHVDNHTVLEHAQPHGDSREVYKGVLADASRTVFNGRIIVRPGAQRTNAKQSNANLVLSNRALAHTRPQLEIYADDVKCTHGATIGRLDEDAITYLRCRGIEQQQARRMLIEAFAGEMLEQVGPDSLRATLEHEVAGRLLAAVERST